jgi:hypothetical protein
VILDTIKKEMAPSTLEDKNQTLYTSAMSGVNNKHRNAGSIAADKVPRKKWWESLSLSIVVYRS